MAIPDEVVVPDSNVIYVSDDELIEAILIPKVGILRQPVIPFLCKADADRTINTYGAWTEYITSSSHGECQKIAVVVLYTLVHSTMC